MCAQFTNGTFESATTDGWTINGHTGDSYGAVATTDFAHTGSYSCCIFASTTGSYSRYKEIYQQNITSSGVYLDYWIQVATIIGSNSIITVSLDNTSTDWPYNLSNTYTATTDGWVYGFFNVPDQENGNTLNGSKIAFNAWAEGASGSDVKFYVDDISDNPLYASILISFYDIIETTIVESTLKSYYDIIQEISKIQSYYDISALYNKTIGSYYDISHNAESKFVLELVDPIFETGEFSNFTITERLMQVPEMRITLVNITDEKQSQITKNAPVRVRVNGNLRFCGYVRQIQKNDNANIWDIYGEGNVCRLRDIMANPTISYILTPATTIISDILPSDWVVHFDLYGDSYTPLDFVPNISYKFDSNSILGHVGNICNICGWEWKGEKEEVDFTITGVTSTTISINKTLVGDYYIGNYGLIYSKSASSVNIGFTIFDNSDTSITASGYNFESDGIFPGDRGVIYGKNILLISTHVGTTDAATTFIAPGTTLSPNIYNLSTASDASAITTNVISTGVNSLVGGMSASISANTKCIFRLDFQEAKLIENATQGASILWADTWEDYPKYTTVQINNERIRIVDSIEYATGWKIQVDTPGNVYPWQGRGYDSTASAAHYVNDDILAISAIKTTQRSGDKAIPLYGTLWIGSEMVAYNGYDSSDGVWIYNLERGYDTIDVPTTPKYRHGKGTVVKLSNFITDSNPESGSIVDIYGVISKRVEAFGALERDIIDKTAGNYLLNAMIPATFITCKYLGTDLWSVASIGDVVNLTNKNGTTSTTRIVGISYSYKDTLSLTLGNPYEYILDSFKLIDRISNISAQKTDNMRTATVLEISSDGKASKVRYDDDPLDEEWVLSV